jgi:putative ABC transport system permease protein
MTRTPPRAAHRLLRWCLTPAALEVVAGDLDEEFARGRSGAWYWRQAIKSALAHGAGRLLSGAAGFGADLRIAGRTLARQRRLALVATLTLGCGVALCATVLTAVNAYLVRGLPYPEAGRLHNVTLFRPGMDLPPKLEALDWASLDDLVELSISWDLDRFNLRGAPYAEAVQSTWVTPDYMEGFGVRTALGRTFEPRDYLPVSPPVAIISHRIWQTRFQGDPGILGKTFESFAIDRPDEIGVFTIVGVLPEHHWHVQAFTDIMAPLKIPNVPYIVRLREGVPPQAVADRVTALVRSRHQMPEAWSAGVDSMQGAYVLTVRPLLLTLASAAGLVLLIASANVAVLLLIRAADRRPELAMRRALGATGGRVARLIVAEAVVLGAAASAVGLFVAQLLVNGLAPLAARQLGRAVPGGPDALQMDGLVLLGVGLAGVVIVAVCSIVPIWASTRAIGATAQVSGHKGFTGSRAQQRARMLLVTTEIAACLALLVSTVVMVQSGLRVLNADIGLRTDGIHVSTISMRLASYPDAASRIALFDRITRESAQVGQLEGIAFANAWPLQAPGDRDVRGGDAPDSRPTRAGVQGVSASYFDVLGIPITDGRGFGASDVPGAPRAAIVSTTLASRLWPGQRAVGRSLLMSPQQGAPVGTAAAEFQVVGVAADTRHSHTDEDTADVFMALSQSGTQAPFVYLRTSGNPAAVFAGFRSALSRVDADLVTGSLRALDDILDQQRAGSRFLAQVLLVFAGMALLLALLGLHGVISYAAGQRRREIAIRMAVGASRASIAALFLRQGAAMVAAGVVAGIGGALALGRLLESQLFGVTANDPSLIALTAAAFSLCAILASFGPARKAARADPAEALKGE